MGKNYYIRKHIPKARIKELKDLVTMDNIYDGTLQEALSEFHKIHIGKSSIGWQFLFNYNDGKYYDKSQKSIDKFLRECIAEGGEFVDEYGDKVDVDSFWEMVKSKKDGFNLKAYQKYEEESWKDYQENPQKYADSLIKPSKPSSYYECHPETFSSDEWHLRFSDSTEFC